MLLIIPGLIILGFLFFAQKWPAFILGVPLVYAFWEAVFIPSLDWNITLLGVLYLSREDFLFGVFFFSWLNLSIQRKPTSKARLHLEIWLMLCFMFFLILEVLIASIISNKFSLSPVLLLRPYIYWPLGLFLWLGILQRVTKNEILRLVNIISWLTVALMVLYILSAIGVSIYPGDRYQVLVIGSNTVVRDFNTFPYWASWALFYFVLKIFFSVQAQRSFNYLLGIAILITGLILNQTRSLILSVFVILGLFAIFILIKGRQKQKMYIGLFIVAAFGVYELLITFFSTNISVLSDRVQELRGGVAQSTLGVRFDSFINVVNFLQVRDPIFGVGLYTPTNQAPVVSYWGDMMWLRILYDLGWVGIILFSVFMLISLFRSIKNIFRAIEPNEKILSWLFFMISLLYLMMTMTSESYTLRYAISMLAVAGILTVNNRSWRIPLETSKRVYMRGEKRL